MIALLGAGGLVAVTAAAPAIELLGSPVRADGAAVAATTQAGALGYADLAAPDPELVVLAGLARAPTVLGVALGEAPSRVLAVPASAPAELGELRETGRAFAFTDPHGNAWTVTEYEASWGHAYGTEVGPVTVEPEQGAYNFVLLVDQGLLGGAARIVAA
jgi:hypothetical protein